MTPDSLRGPVMGHTLVISGGHEFNALEAQSHLSTKFNSEQFSQMRVNSKTNRESQTQSLTQNL